MKSGTKEDQVGLLGEARADQMSIRIPNEVAISSTDYWFKIVGMLQQNWALVDDLPGGGAMVYFVNDTSGVFDRIEFASRSEAAKGLRRNGFGRFADDEKVHEVLRPPAPPFVEAKHPNGPIYSSGRYWR